MPSKEFYKNKYTECLKDASEIGFIEKISYPLVYVKGLPHSFSKEVVYFETGIMGMVLSISKDYVEILVFSHKAPDLGTQVVRSGIVLQVPVGDKFLGHTIDSLGKSVYENVSGIDHAEYRSIETPPLDISKREKITEPFVTGVSVVDLMIPLGKGQRQLVLGDRKIGKTAFIMQTMLNSSLSGNICIYAAIGRSKADIKEIESFAEKNNFRDKVIIIASSSYDPHSYIYIAPYVAMTMAEYFRDNGSNVLVIMDDLTSHAKYYRELSLLGGRFPGRNSYPGDIFYTHSRLLERAGNFKTANGIKSITCLPVVETIEGDISGFVQTNLMSITDGHIYFDRDLFKEGRRPAVNYSLSVTRVGRQTQSKIRWGVNRELNSFLNLYDRTLSFTHFGAEINEGIKSTLTMGAKLFKFFDQQMGVVVALNVQIITFCLIWSNLLKFDDMERYRMSLVRANQLYVDNSSFKELVDSSINTATDFNSLLGLISSKYETYLNFYNS